MRRRDLLKGLVGTGATIAGTSLHPLFSGLARAYPDPGGGFEDYKALVVVFLSGGNDSFNMILPGHAGGENGYKAYRNTRGDAAVSDRVLNGFRKGKNAYAEKASSDPEAYLSGMYRLEEQGVGINAMMPEIARLIEDRNASVVLNAGTLVEPVTRNTVNQVKLPPFLFAHNEQQRALQTGWADNLAASGWAGRIADLWMSEEKTGNSSSVGLNISLAGRTRMLSSAKNTPLVLDPMGLELFDSSYPGFDEEIYARLNSGKTDDPARQLVRQENHRAATISAILRERRSEMPDFSAIRDPYGNALFSTPDRSRVELRSPLQGKLLAGARNAARLLALGKNSLGLKRQIVYLDLGGFDTHANQINRHPRLLRELSLALWDFQLAMESLNMANEVTVFTLSDFGRSLGINGSGGAGTDHGWGGHNLVMGGAVNGGQVLGEMPGMVLGGESDHSSKGRMIPTIAADQYLATLCHWFGLSDAENAEIFPNLTNFATSGESPVSSAYLPGLFKT